MPLPSPLGDPQGLRASSSEAELSWGFTQPALANSPQVTEPSLGGPWASCEQSLAPDPKSLRFSRAQTDGIHVFQVPILIPCHRVVCSSGALGNYSGGLDAKEWLLAHEGSPVGRPARRVDSHPARAWLRDLGGTTSPQPAGRN